MNLMSALLVNLWVAGWAFAMLRAALRVRATEIAASPRENAVRGSDNLNG
jgi:hypothetical protein